MHDAHTMVNHAVFISLNCLLLLCFNQKTANEAPFMKRWLNVVPRGGAANGEMT